MIYLPIIQRELIVAARRKGAHRVRWWTALIGAGTTLICFFVLSSKPIPTGATNPLFAVLAACAFLVCLLAGVFLTSDSLSEEKRQGTLGLLFLSHLREGDVIFGKFTALAVNAFFAVLTLLPVMGVPLLLGGVDPSEFFRVVGSLLNMLFVSLAAGMCVSAFGGTQSGVSARTLVLLIVLCGVLPALGEFMPFWKVTVAVSWLSPAYPFAYAFEVLHTRRPARFWSPLLLSHLVGWLFLWLATYALSKRWRDSGLVKQDHGNEAANSRWADESGGRKKRRGFSAGNAVELLLGDAPVTQWLIWSTLALYSVVLITHWSSGSRSQFTFGGAKICALLLKMLAAVQACKFFSESKSTGVLELMLCTPLQNVDIIRAQWRKLRRLFLLPSFVLLVSTVLILALAGAGAKPAGIVWKSWVGEPGLAQVCWLGLRMAADMLAVGWLGMSFGLTLKKPILAPGLTILLVLILPSILSWLDLVADMLFISWGTARLQKDFRDVLIQRYQQVTNPGTLAEELSPA